MKFTKIQGTGNDFIIIDDRENKFIGRESELSKKLCDRHFGIGGDGILLIRKSNIASIQMVIINSDGSYAAMCGNGIRCFAKYVFDEGILSDNPVKIETGDGVKEAFLNLKNGVVESVTIDMGKPSFLPHDIPAEYNKEIVDEKINAGDREYSITTMLMGVPHTVVFGKLKNYDTVEGRNIEKYKIFPEGTNVNFCEVINNEGINIKTWERGAGATLACGTGCCASAVAANKLGFTGKKVSVKVPGGQLFIEIKDTGVFMTGPAVVSFKGEYEI
ncbi:diaminopimelate epimerase [Clostridium algifaecis]|uniref:Diaminopimelate epimerase n=1 Tax=Clostridium algifaecis TaxID=1472040 RepID=A0ABS4KN42_9CLOT|nr:diaminopimelate epimerase [Clostridium algifaecis]MBP2031453.1 diaminopimelate epimerase [Clostridium algifaecis]